jgi:hypothetical protein
VIGRVSFVGVAWNEAVRAPALMSLMREHFGHMVVAVQSSTDETLDIVKRYADRTTDKVLEHPHFGFGDRSFPALLGIVETPWTLVISFDEMPNGALLAECEGLTIWADEAGVDAFWIPFESTIEGIRYEEQHSHLRLFRTELGWPAKLHSRPAGKREATLGDDFPGRISHDRSLDEMIQDYLRYFEAGRGNAQWTEHNLMMMREACKSVAAKHGWGYVQAYDWWPEVLKLAFHVEPAT